MTPRRLLGALVGLLLGFGGAFAVVQAVERGGPGEPAETVLGAPDVNRHCAGIGPSFTAMLQSTDAFGWRCIGLTNRTWDERTVDFTAVCAAQFGDNVYSTLLDDTDPTSWRCVIRN